MSSVRSSSLATVVLLVCGLFTLAWSFFADDDSLAVIAAVCLVGAIVVLALANDTTRAGDR